MGRGLGSFRPLLKSSLRPVREERRDPFVLTAFCSVNTFGVARSGGAPAVKRKEEGWPQPPALRQYEYE